MVKYIEFHEKIQMSTNRCKFKCTHFYESIQNNSHIGQVWSVCMFCCTWFRYHAKWTIQGVTRYQMQWHFALFHYSLLVTHVIEYCCKRSTVSCCITPNIIKFTRFYRQMEVYKWYNRITETTHFQIFHGNLLQHNSELNIGV